MLNKNKVKLKKFVCVDKLVGYDISCIWQAASILFYCVKVALLTLQIGCVIRQPYLYVWRVEFFLHNLLQNCKSWFTGLLQGQRLQFQSHKLCKVITMTKHLRHIKMKYTKCILKKAPTKCTSNMQTWRVFIIIFSLLILLKHARFNVLSAFNFFSD